METIRPPRPLAVKLAVVVMIGIAAWELLAMATAGFAADATIEIACFLLVAWLIFRGNDWARWFFLCLLALELLAELIVLPLAFMSPRLSQRLIQDYGLAGTLAVWSGSLLQVIAAAGLFSKSSSQWFKACDASLSPSTE